MTPRVAAAATAASTALPPWRSTSRPAAEASRSTVAIAPPVPVATGCLTPGSWPRWRGRWRRPGRGRGGGRPAGHGRGRFIAGPPAGCDGSLRSLVHHATFGQVCPSSGCLPQSRSSRDFLGFCSAPATRSSKLGPWRRRGSWPRSAGPCRRGPCRRPAGRPGDARDLPSRRSRIAVRVADWSASRPWRLLSWLRASSARSSSSRSVGLRSSEAGARTWGRPPTACGRPARRPGCARP